MKTSVKNIIQAVRVKANNNSIIHVIIIIVVVVIIASFGGSGSGFVL